MPRVLIPMADYGHDPTEVAIPWSIFHATGYTIDFATEKGAQPACDKLMLEGVTGALLGADSKAKAAYAEMRTSPSFQQPRAWTDPAFTMDAYDLVMLPGGHDKGVRQLIDSDRIHSQLGNFFPQTARSKVNDRGSNTGKVIAAVCHGVQVLAFTPAADSPVTTPLDLNAGPAQLDKDTARKFRSVIHACATTALPGFMETSIYRATCVFLGDYYKTYGAGTPTVQEYVMAGLDEPEKQFKAGPGMLSLNVGVPFVVEDETYRYVSGRFPPDAEALAKRAVQLIEEVRGSRNPESL